MCGRQSDATQLHTHRADLKAWLPRFDARREDARKRVKDACQTASTKVLKYTTGRRIILIEMR